MYAKFDNYIQIWSNGPFSVDPGSTLGEAVCHALAVRPSPLTSFVYNSGSGWDPFLKSVGHILGMFVDYFWIIQNFLYVCQSVSWLTFLLKIDKYRDISTSGWDIFLKFFGDIPRIFPDYLQIIYNFLYVCQSVSWLTFYWD